MPLVRISLFEGRSPAEIRAIADGVHQALVDTFGVPADDRFQIVEEIAPGKIIYSPSYLDITRSDQIVIVHIFAGNWRDTATKQALYAAIASRLGEHAGVSPGDVQIVLSLNDRPDWALGNGIASYVRNDDVSAEPVS